MNRSEWIANVLDRKITAPGAWGGQCVDAADDYLARVYGLQPVRLNAIDWYRVGVAGFAKTANTPTNYPDAGDLVVWGQSLPIGTTENGHIAICIAADSVKLLTLDQNWAGQQRCRVYEHDYRGVIGWLRRTPVQ